MTSRAPRGGGAAAAAHAAAAVAVAVVVLARSAQATGPHSTADQSRQHLLQLTASARPAQADPEFDCAWRKLALEYAPTLQLLTPAQHQQLYDALQLKGLCNQSCV